MAALIQQITGSKGATGTTITLTLAAAPRISSTLILAVGINDETQTVSTVTGGGVTWVRQKQNTANTTSKCTVEIWEGYRADCSSSVVIVTNSGTAESGANLSEWYGLLYNNPDVTAVGNASSVSPVSGTATPAWGPDLAIGAAFYKNTTAPSAGPTNSFTALTNTTVSTTDTLVVAYKVVPIPASTSTGWTITSAAWAGALACFSVTNIVENNYQFARDGGTGDTGILSFTEKRR